MGDLKVPHQSMHTILDKKNLHVLFCSLYSVWVFESYALSTENDKIMAANNAQRWQLIKVINFCWQS